MNIRKFRIALAICLFPSLLPVVVSAAAPEKVRFERISFELPAGKWKRSNSGEILTLTQTLGAQRHQALSMWRVNVPRERATNSVRQHATGYFAAERGLQRDPGQQWQDFSETTLTAGNRSFHSMTYRVTYDDPKVGLVKNARFVLVFPADFATTQAFYCLMWVDIHAAGTIPVDDPSPLLRVLQTATPAPLLPTDIELLRTIELGSGSSVTDPVAMAESRSIVAKAGVVSQFPDRYSSLVRVTQAADARQTVWWVETAPGARFHVFQVSGKAMDEWISIGNDEYRNAGLWLRPPQKYQDADTALNRFFSPGKFLRLMAAAEPVSVGRVVLDGQWFAVLEYQVAAWADISPPFLLTPDPARVQVWIDLKTGYVAKGAIMARQQSGGQELHIEQSYAGREAPVRIEPPSLVVNDQGR